MKVFRLDELEEVGVFESIYPSSTPDRITVGDLASLFAQLIADELDLEGLREEIRALREAIQDEEE